MSNAWETTTEDVLNVVHSMGKKLKENEADEILNNLDQFAIEDAALNGNDIEEQTDYAYDEIKRQLFDHFNMKELPCGAEVKCRKSCDECPER